MNRIYLIIALAVLTLFCAVLLFDQYRLNTAFSNAGRKMEEKQQIFQQTELEYKQQLENLKKQLKDRERSFRFVTDQRILIQPETVEPEIKNPFQPVPVAPPVLKIRNNDAAQFQNEPELAAAAERIAALIPEPVTAEGIEMAFRKYLEDEKITDLFLNDPTNHRRLIRLDAAILEALCKQLKFTVRTELFWDMNSLKNSARITFHPENDPAQKKSLILPAGARLRGAVPQTKATTTLLAFPEFVLDQDQPYHLLLNIHQIPVGGLYIHRIDMRCAKGNPDTEWMLEYKFRSEDNEEKMIGNLLPADRKIAKRIPLQAISLLNGQPVASALSKNRQTFRVPCSFDGRSSLLIIGDMPVIPETITAFPIKDK